MNEASKTRSLWTERELLVLQGKGIDIGCGPDPVMPGVLSFDVEQGDANAITLHVKDTFDYVFSAHCLEHMRDPRAAILEWWKLVKPGGHLFVIVPDEDLYEQGIWPSVFNSDHKATFTTSRGASWCHASVNVFDLIGSLPGGETIDVRHHDHGYERAYLRRWRCPRLWAAAATVLRWNMLKILRKLGVKADLKWFARVFQAPIDQTIGAATAQIQMIVRKRAV